MGDEWTGGNVAKVAVVMVLVGIVIMLAINGIAGTYYRISAPITDLELGKVYEVQGLTKDGDSCFLLLRAGEKIKFYQLPSNEVPTDLEAGDGLVKTSIGLERRPHEFS